MGSPRRFFGSGEPTEIDGITIPARCVVEVTFGVHQHRHLARPDDECNEILLGCFGRAYHRYPGLNLHVLKILSTHGHLLAKPDAESLLSNFMRDFLSDSATRLNNLRGREGTFWEPRFRAIPVIDEAKMDDRFRYILTHGTKENLVWNAKDWPGVSSVAPLLGGPKLVGRWLDGTATSELNKQRRRKIERAAKRGVKREIEAVLPVWRQYPIELVPMPHWENLKVGQRRARVARMIHDDAEATQKRHKRDHSEPCGAEAVLSTSPFKRTENRKKSPAPLCHASTKKGRNAFRAAYRAFCELRAKATDRVKTKLPSCGLPRYATLAPLRNAEPPRNPEPQPPLIDARGRIIAEPTARPAAIGPPAIGPPATGPPRP